MGLLILAGGVLLAIPVANLPMNNFFPALMIFFAALARIERDGLMVILLGRLSLEEVAKEVEAVVLAPVPAIPASAPSIDNSGMILNYSILNGALELLPETLASMAILPMQMKMVYRIEKSHGVAIDRSRIKEFLAVAGVGLGSQMSEGLSRKFLGGHGKKLGRKMARKAANQVAGSAFSFCTTYALDHLAE